MSYDPIKYLVNRKIAEDRYMKVSVKVDKNGVLRVRSHNAYLEYIMITGLISILFASFAIEAVSKKLNKLDWINKMSMRNAFLILILFSSNSSVPFFNAI